MSGQFPPLNVIYWNGKDIGRKNGNSRFSKTIKEMVEYCSAVNFLEVFEHTRRWSKPDLIVLGEIFPTSRFKDSSLIGSGVDWRKVHSGYKGRLISLGGEENENFLIAYNTDTVGEIEVNSVPLQENKKNALELVVKLIDAHGRFRNCPYKIMAFHIENTGRKTLMDAITEWANNRVNFRNSPHLLIGDTNLPVHEFLTTSDLNSIDGNAIKFHEGIKELKFENLDQGYTVKDGRQSNSVVDRAWINKNFIQAKGYYLLYDTRRRFSFSSKITVDLGLGRISDHPAMLVRLIKH